MQLRWNIPIHSFLLVAVLAAVYLLVISFPGNLQPINPTLLDDSWAWALNYVANSNFVFGRDVVFTYGPLGYLLVPKHMGLNLFHSLMFMMFVHFLWAIVLVIYLQASKRWQFLLFVFGYAIVYALGLSYEYHLLSLVILFCYLPSKLNYPKTSAGFVAGALAANFALIKFNLGVTAILTIIISTLCWRLQFGSRANRLIITAYSTFLLGFIALSTAYFHSVNNFLSWLHGTIEIASGYSAAMSLIDMSVIPCLGVSLLCIFAITTFLLLWKKNEVGYLALTALGSIFFAFKHGFVRQDEHETAFFIFLLAIIVMMVLACRGAKAASLCFQTFVLIGVIVLQMLFQSGVSLKAIASVLNTSQGQQHIKNLLSLNSVIKRIDQQTETNCDHYKLSKALLEHIMKAGNPAVATLPNCVGYCAANNLRWSPLPVVQLYSAYTPYLDKLCADYFTGKAAPQFIIYGSTADLAYDFGEIDHRHPILEAPLTAVALLQNYEFLQAYKNPDVLLLQKRKVKQQISFANFKAQKYRLNEWLIVPDSSSFLLAKMKLRPKPIPYILSKLYHLPPLYVEATSDDSFCTYRLIPANLSSGLLLNCFPRDLFELPVLMKGNIPNQVKVIRITGPASTMYYPQVEISWVKILLDSSSP